MDYIISLNCPVSVMRLHCSLVCSLLSSDSLVGIYLHYRVDEINEKGNKLFPKGEELICSGIQF
jgi:hypothetical protein